MANDWLGRLGLGAVNSGVHGARSVERPGGPEIVSVDPATGRPIARVVSASAEDYHRVVEDAQEAFLTWRSVPPPVRGEVVRQIGQALRERKADLGLLVTLETGKIRTEGEGEVQEMIDMCRLRRRPVPAALRADDRQRAAAPPDDRAMAPARAGRGHHGVQLPGRRLGLERHGRGRLRRHDGLEALPRDAAGGPRRAARLAAEVAARHGYPGVFNLCVGGADDVGERMLADTPAAPDLGHRELPDGRPGRRGGRPPARPDDPRTRRQQRG